MIGLVDDLILPQANLNGRRGTPDCLRLWTVQLVGLASTFNGPCVLKALAGCGTLADLPIRSGEVFATQRESVMEFVSNLLRSGEVPFSVRFRTRLHNTCLDGLTQKSRRLIQYEIKKMLSWDDAASLSTLKTYSQKLELLSRLKGYADDATSHFSARISPIHCPR